MPRWATPRNPSRDTRGPRIGRVARELGSPLMPWQQDAADVTCEIDPATGHLFYRVVVLTVMRQQGKTTLTLPVWVERAISFPGIHVKWTMQSGTDATRKWKGEHVPAILGSPLAKFVVPGDEGYRKQNGSEHLKFTNGSMQTLMSSKKSAGHGEVVDLGMIDEAMAQLDDRLEVALEPAMKTRYRNITRPDGSVQMLPGAQMWIISTVGSAGEAEWFHRWVDAGRLAVDNGTCEEDRICYIEYSAGEDEDPGDPDTWWGCMPALGYTYQEDTVRSTYQRALLTPGGLAKFRRTDLNQRTSQAADPPIPLHLWDACAAQVGRGDSDSLVWAVDVSPLQASAAIAVAWRRADGVPQVEVVAHHPGVGWLPGVVSDLRARHGGMWLLDPRGASASQAADWPGETMKPAEAKQACAQLEAAVREGEFGHCGQPELRSALEGAVKRPSEDGGWSWARRSTMVDISPLVAVTLAHGGLVSGVVAGDPLLSVW